MKPSPNLIKTWDNIRFGCLSVGGGWIPLGGHPAMAEVIIVWEAAFRCAVFANVLLNLLISPAAEPGFGSVHKFQSPAAIMTEGVGDADRKLNPVLVGVHWRHLL